MLASLPKVLTTAQIAALLSSTGERWDARKARNRLRRSGAITKEGGRWVTTPERLMASAPTYGEAALFASFGGE